MAKARGDNRDPGDHSPLESPYKERALSKITRPDAQGAWPRTRLFALLDAVRTHRVVWISASAGSGKTTLASSYCQSRQIQSLWYQIDSGDVDIGSFFHYLGLAADALATPSAPHPLPPLDPVSGIDHFARKYMRELYRRLAPSGMIVFDNYQDASSELLDAVVRIAAAELPSGINMMVLSRFPPPSAFSGLIVNGTMLVLDEGDMRLDYAETVGIARHLGAQASDEVVKRWDDSARGWVAGLVLLAKAGARIDPETERTGIRNLLFDYFSAEIMSHLAGTEREALLRASFLRTMTADGVAQLVGSGDAGALLERLHAQNFFTLKRQDSYQFHPLFHEFLANQAHKSLDRGVLDQIRLKAARISVAEARLDDGIELLIEAASWSELGQIIPANAAVVAAQGRLKTLERWIDAIPAAQRMEYPWLGFWLGVCRLPYDPDEASSQFAACIPLFDRQDDLAGVAASWSKQIEAILHVWGDFARLDEPLALIDRVITDANLALLPSRLQFELVQNALLALQWRQPDHPRLSEIEQRASALLQFRGDPNLQAACSTYLSLYYCWRGKYPKARTTLETLRTVMQYASLSPPMLAGAKVTECLMAWRVDADFDRCLATVDAALKLCAEADVNIWDTNLIGQAAAAALSKGDHSAAGAMLERMRDRLPQSRRFDAAQYFLLAAWHSWLQRRTSLAREHIMKAVEVFSAIGVPWGIGLAHAGYALMVGRGDSGYEEHQALATRQVEFTHSTEIEFPLLLARINDALDLKQEQDARELIARLFAIGRENSVWNCYFWDDALMARNCVIALEGGIERDYVVDLIRLRNLVPADPALAPDNWPWPIKIHALGGLGVHLDRKPVSASGKGPAKPLALLQLLIVYGGADVSENKIIDALWPDSEADAALRALDTTLHRLRRLLADDQAVQLKNKRLSLNPARVWVDAHVFRHLVGRARGAEMVAAIGLYQRAIDMYRGPFLDDEDGKPFIVERKRLQREFIEAIHALGSLYEQRGDWGLAIECYEKGLAIDSLAESLYQRLMIALRELRRPAEGLAVYQRCCETLSSTLAAVPSAETEGISETLRRFL